MARACELAARGLGNTAPNPPVGAVLVRNGQTLGEGFHHRRGEPHAEIEALRDAGGDAKAATCYVSLEPCDHTGLTPPCTDAIIRAGIARVVIGARDPTARTSGGGAARLHEAGIEVEILDDVRANELIEPFLVSAQQRRPFVTLKMAASLDGFISTHADESRWLTGAQSRAFVRELRIAHDAVLVGAGTVLVDDPQLTVRPPHLRERPYRRVCIAGWRVLPPERRIFAPLEGYLPTVVLAAGPPEHFGQLGRLAEIVQVGEGGSVEVRTALDALWQRGVTSILCEGGPALAASFVSAGVVDRLEWLVAPLLLSSNNAVPALGALPDDGERRWSVDHVERLGADLRISAHPLASV
jgi:diaminohydroxyphosphoribosylaminopyrimidine deaminase / 5-amino-6-(5-phosphoribosylamino)uracil reductase